jgi:hypothetical protein
LPLPLWPSVIVMKPAFDVAVQAHALGAVTLTECVPPSSSKLREDGSIAKVHSPAWFTVSVWPPTDKVPVRAGPVFAATVKATEPLPLPVAPAVIVSHGSLLDAVHEQPAGAETVVLAALAVAGTDWIVGLTVTVHAVSEVPA